MKRIQVKKLNNDGAALIFAILVVTFVTILTSLLLYLSAVNYVMKTVDYRTRISFYGAEVPMEELRMQLAVDATKASELAYESVLGRYGILGTEDARNAEYQNKFVEEMLAIWNNRTGSNWAEKLKTALNNSNYDVRFEESANDGNKAWHVTILTNPVNDAGEAVEQFYRGVDANSGRMVFENVHVVYTENGFVSEIVSDICINIPEMDWSVNESSSPDTLSDMDAARKKINLEEYVTYLNWTKK